MTGLRSLLPACLAWWAAGSAWARRNRVRAGRLEVTQLSDDPAEQARLRSGTPAPSFLDYDGSLNAIGR